MNLKRFLIYILLFEVLSFSPVEAQNKTETDNAVADLGILMNKLARGESNALLKKHFESVAILATDTTHGFDISEENQEEAAQVLLFFQSEGSAWQTYADGPRPLIMSFESPTDGKITYYKLFLPGNFDKQREDYPLYLELHGSGGGKNDNPRKMLFMSLKPEIKGVTTQGYLKEGFFIYPWGRGDKGYSGIAETDIYEVLAHFDAMFETDRQKQYIYGFSMGGRGTLNIAGKTIERWTAAGFFSTALRDKPTEEQVAPFKQIPVWMVWGEEDKRWVDNNRVLKDLFLEAGVDLEWEEIKEMGHNYSGEYQGQMMDWFRTKQKE